MTILVGVWCKDSVVIGADSAATFSVTPGYRTIEQPSQKIDIVNDNIIVAGSGPVGLGQRFKSNISELWSKGELSGSKCGSAIDFSKKISKAGIDNFRQTYSPAGQYGALVAFPFHDKPHLCEFGISDFQPELKNERIWYVSMGCGQPIADPFLGLMRQVFWENGLPPTCEDAVFAVTWTLMHAVKVNPGGINEPIYIAILKKNANKYEAKLLEQSEIMEHRGNVDGAIVHLRTYRDKLRDTKNAADVPISVPTETPH